MDTCFLHPAGVRCCQPLSVSNFRPSPPGRSVGFCFHGSLAQSWPSGDCVCERGLHQPYRSDKAWVQVKGSCFRALQWLLHFPGLLTTLGFISGSCTRIQAKPLTHQVAPAAILTQQHFARSSCTNKLLTLPPPSPKLLHKLRSAPSAEALLVSLESSCLESGQAQSLSPCSAIKHSQSCSVITGK